MAPRHSHVTSVLRALRPAIGHDDHPSIRLEVLPTSIFLDNPCTNQNSPHATWRKIRIKPWEDSIFAWTKIVVAGRFLGSDVWCKNQVNHRTNTSTLGGESAPWMHLCVSPQWQWPQSNAVMGKYGKMFANEHMPFHDAWWHHPCLHASMPGCMRNAIRLQAASKKNMCISFGVAVTCWSTLLNGYLQEASIS